MDDRRAADQSPACAGRCTTRRAVMSAGAVGGGALILAGCGSSDEGGGSSSGSGGSAGSGEEVRVASGEVPEGGGTVSGSVVVTQPSAGEYAAFDATCPHQGCAVDEVTSDAIVCPCHGSTFDPATGEVTKGPAETGLTTREVTLDGDQLVVT